MSRFIVHDRVGVRGQNVPVDEDTFKDIPEELYSDLDRVQQYATELENARHELGRLMQLVSHLTNVCNTADRNLTQAKKSIIEGMDLEDANWAIDFERKQIGKVLPVQKPMPRVA